MIVDLYHAGGCMTCGGGEHITSFMARLATQYGFTLNTHDTQIFSERTTAETFREDFPLGQFYFPLVVIAGVGKVCGYKPQEIEDAIKEAV